jgi:hypothetical protein
MSVTIMLFQLKKLPEIINLTRFLKSFWILYIDQIIVYNAFYSKLTFYIIKDRCQMTLSGSHSGNSFEFSHRLTDFLNYALFCLSFCLRLNLKPVNYFTRKGQAWQSANPGPFALIPCSPWARSS